MPGLQLLPFLSCQGKTNREGKITSPPPQIRVNMLSSTSLDFNSDMGVNGHRHNDG